jgi:hypothetical protein
LIVLNLTAISSEGEKFTLLKRLGFAAILPSGQIRRRWPPPAASLTSI